VFSQRLRWSGPAVGLGGLEPPASSLSAECGNRCADGRSRGRVRPSRPKVCVQSAHWYAFILQRSTCAGQRTARQALACSRSGHFRRMFIERDERGAGRSGARPTSGLLLISVASLRGERGSPQLVASAAGGSDRWSQLSLSVTSGRASRRAKIARASRSRSQACGCWRRARQRPNPSSA
jgi:hypothetical protein